MFQFDYKKMNILEFIRSLEKGCSMRNSFSKSSEGSIKFDVQCPFVQIQNRAFELER